MDISTSSTCRTVHHSTSPNRTLPRPQAYDLSRALVVRVKLVIPNYPLFDIDLLQSLVLQMFSREICDSHKAFVLSIATESYDVLVLWIQNLEATIDEHVFVFPTKLQATLPVREDRFSIWDLSCCVDIGVVVIDSHPWLDVRLAKSSVWSVVPLHRSPSMVACLQLEQCACVVELTMVVGILRLSTTEDISIRSRSFRQY